MEAMAGRTQNIVEVIKTYGRQLFGFIRSRVQSDEEAEDILQDVWYQFSRQPEIEAIESVSGWLYRVARNRITDNYRRRRNEPLDIGEDGGEEGIPEYQEILVSEDSDPEMEQLRQLFWETLMSALDELPENQRQVFIWNEMEERSFREISEVTGDKIKTLISRKRYAVRHLRSRLDDLYNEIVNR